MTPMFRKRATDDIHATLLELDSKQSRVKCRGDLLYIPTNSTFEFVNAIGDGSTAEKRPPKGKNWLKDHHSNYWEVDDVDLQGKYEDAPREGSL
jgi:hypothetical protein